MGKVTINEKIDPVCGMRVSEDGEYHAHIISRISFSAVATVYINSKPILNCI